MDIDKLRQKIRQRVEQRTQYNQDEYKAAQSLAEQSTGNEKVYFIDSKKKHYAKYLEDLCILRILDEVMYPSDYEGEDDDNCTCGHQYFQHNRTEGGCSECGCEQFMKA